MKAVSDLNISLILRFVDRATAPARRAMGAMNGLSGRVRAGVGAISDEFSRWNRLLKAGTVLSGAYGLSLTAMAVGGVRAAAQFERFEVQLTTLEGSAEGAKRAMAWIEDFATRTPIELDKTVAAYAKLKAFGIDPTNGSMQALVDTMAATGGGAEQLDGLVLALGQAWSKGKLQGEEALQMLERGVPVWDILAKKLGKTTAEVQAMATAGKLGRDEISLLVEGLGEANKGASENMSRTWDGIISNLMDYWTKFQRMVMGSGVFTYLKSRLRSLLDLLDQMSRDGRLQMWADRVASAILAALEAAWAFGEGVVTVWQTLAPWVQAAVDAFGGWKNVLVAIIGLNFARSLVVIAAAFGPVGWAIMGIATAGYLIYENWDKIVAYFRDVIDRLKAWFSDLKQSIIDAFSVAMPDWMKAGPYEVRDLGNEHPSVRDYPYSGHYAGPGKIAPGVTPPPRALGGPVRAGQIYRWMEEGAEFFSPRTDGAVISTREMKALRSGGSSSRSVRIGDIIIHAVAGQSAEDIARAVRRELERLTRLAGSPLHDGGAYAD